MVLVYPIPETGYNIPTVVSRLTMMKRNPSTFVRPVAYYFQHQKFVFDIFNSLDQIRLYAFTHTSVSAMKGTVLYMPMVSPFIATTII